ncbi:MAG: site-specific DNA-methyltransferase [Ignavibacteria bacterium]|nr:site-specific DNA-methyltransferase [Ignavibacteria bacterium]
MFGFRYNKFFIIIMEQLFLFNDEKKNLVGIKEASLWASKYLRKKITPNNISYLLQYGKINKYGNDGYTLIDIQELKAYYDSISKEKEWKKVLGEDVNWYLSFAQYSESERTKHVHRLHPYKGKFIPQLVEYFLDEHIDEFKKEVYFRKGDIVLDPFCGSGTTLVQANELGLHCIGIDISSFNVLISEVKIENHNLELIENLLRELNSKLISFQEQNNNIKFEEELSIELTNFNNRHFPSPDYKRKVEKKEIDENEYAKERLKEFLSKYYELVKKYNLKIEQDQKENFLGKWYLYPVRKELDYLANEIKLIEDNDVKKVLTLILSRTARSCRATTHADLATLKNPVIQPYYCKKHSKICRPLFTISKWWEYYTKDTINRLKEFEKLRTNTFQTCLIGDSREIDIYSEVKKKNKDFAELLLKQKIRGIFTSPPYVGLIDYHEQHAYAYELFGFERRDELEIGPFFRGQGEEQKNSYIQSIAKVLINCKKYMQDNFDIFLVANDKFNLYPQIAKIAKLKIVEQFKRPVLNRVEKDRETPYSETIFHMKGL